MNPESHTGDIMGSHCGEWDIASVTVVIVRNVPVITLFLSALSIDVDIDMYTWIQQIIKHSHTTNEVSVTFRDKIKPNKYQHNISPEKQQVLVTVVMTIISTFYFL